MSIPVNQVNELIEAIKFTRLIKVNFERENTWNVFLIYEVKDDEISLIVDNNKYNLEMKENDVIFLKFVANDFEYFVYANILEITDYNILVITLKNFKAQKFYNIRKHNRFETNIDVSIFKKDGIESFKGTVENISIGGALLGIEVNSLEKGDIIKLNIPLNGEFFKTEAEILRKSEEKGKIFYGIRFIDLTDKDYSLLKDEIIKYEKDVFKMFNFLREFKKLDDIIHEKKILILNYTKFEKVDIRESLSKLQAQNYEVIEDFDYYIDYFELENPDIVIIDADDINDKVKYTIVNIKQSHPGIKILIIVPFELIKTEEINILLEDLTVLYRPLIFNEFEESIIKYL